MGIVKTTVEIPDQLFREAKVAAALRERLRSKPATAPRWMQAFGGLRDLHRETKRLRRVNGW